jgi:hypothetical protein
MATKPTKEQIQKLETAHKVQYVNLVLANRLFLRLLPRVKGKSTTSKEVIALNKLGKSIANNAHKWYLRQTAFEKKAGIPKVGLDLMKNFGSVVNEKKLIEQAKAYLNPAYAAQTDPMFNPMGNIAGMGIIPLLIWAAIALIAAFTAVEVTDQLNTTAEEKADLLKATEETLKNLEITGPQAAAVISQTQEQASASGGGLLNSITGGGTGKLLLYGGLAYLLLSSSGQEKAKSAYAGIKSRVKKK